MTAARNIDTVRECVQAYIAACTDEDGRQSSIAYWDAELAAALEAVEARLQQATDAALMAAGNLESFGYPLISEQVRQVLRGEALDMDAAEAAVAERAALVAAKEGTAR